MNKMKIINIYFREKKMKLKLWSMMNKLDLFMLNNLMILKNGLCKFKFNLIIKNN